MLAVALSEGIWGVIRTLQSTDCEFLAQAGLLKLHTINAGLSCLVDHLRSEVDAFKGCKLI